MKGYEVSEIVDATPQIVPVFRLTRECKGWPDNRPGGSAPVLLRGTEVYIDPRHHVNCPGIFGVLEIDAKYLKFVEYRDLKDKSKRFAFPRRRVRRSKHIRRAR